MNDYTKTIRRMLKYRSSHLPTLQTPSVVSRLTWKISELEVNESTGQEGSDFELCLKRNTPFLVVDNSNLKRN